jgi:hydroxymethylpyrimidine pyrophosphatase-like HAD family hydrolase
MAIRLVVSDNDGCFGNYAHFGRPAHEDLTPHVKDYDRIHGFLVPHSVTFGMCTGRSITNSAKIIHELGMNAPCALEMGAMTYDPRTHQTTVLAYEPDFETYKKAQDEIRWFYDFVARSNGQIAARTGCRIMHLDDRRNIVTLELDGRTGHDVAGILREMMNDELRACLADGTALLIPSYGAIDVIPAIGKGGALRHIRKKLGEVPYSQTLAIGDSSHTDIDMMRKARYVGCPSNADAATRRYVARRKYGHVSSKPYAEGVLDILEYFLS